MKCPYCDAEMQAGYVRSSQVMRWGKNKELAPDAQDIRLTKYFWKGLFEGFFVPSHYCGNCKKIILSLHTEE